MNLSKGIEWLTEGGLKECRDRKHEIHLSISTLYLYLKRKTDDKTIR